MSRPIRPAEIRGMRLALFTLVVLGLALVAAPSVFAQGALASSSSFYQPAQFSDVSCLADADSKPAHGQLTFDSRTHVECAVKDGSGFTIPYASVTRLVLHQGERQNEKADTSSRFSFHELLPSRNLLKSLETDRYLTIYFNDTDGREKSSSVRMSNRNWQVLLAVAENKTGRKVERATKGVSMSWSGNW